MRSEFGWLAPIANPYPAETRRRRSLRHKSAQPLTQFQIWPQPPVLLRRKRRHIHRIADQAFRQIVAHLQRDQCPNFFLRLRRRSSNMRRRNQIRQTNQRRILRRLRRKRIHRRARQTPRAQLISRAPFFICANAAAFIIFSVAALSAVCSEITSERFSKSSSETSSTSSSRAAAGVTYGSYARTFISSARARRATSDPTRPSPTRPSVFPRHSIPA